MSNPSKRFECHWQPSRRLCEVYLCVQALAVLTLCLTDLPLWARLAGVLLCVLHALWTLPRHIWLSSAQSFHGLLHDDNGWQIQGHDGAWRAITLLPDSMALPALVVLRFRLPGSRYIRSQCIPADAMARDQHRRLRVRLKFSRQRWRVAE